jgi:hypothetical protein
MIKHLTPRSEEEIKAYELKENKRINRFHKFNKKWKLTDEWGGATFNERFPIDKIYLYYTPLKKCRLRFVKYPRTPEDSVEIQYYSFYKKIIFWRWEKLIINPKEYGPKQIYQYDRVMKIKECEKLYGVKLINDC